MSSPMDTPREHPSTYVVQDRSNQDELARLQIQDQLLTAGMGGVLPEQPDPTRFQRVLDVGCGTGAWLIETAKMYPGIQQLVGVDISQKMVDYARIQAQAQGVSDRVQFRLMDALRMLEFPDRSFDLVNQRLGMGYLRTLDWPKLLQEYQRVVRWNGVIRVTEGNVPTTNSPALAHLNAIMIEAFYRSGRFPQQETDSMINDLEHKLRRCGLQDIQTRTHALEYRTNTPEGTAFFEDERYAFQTFLPFLRKWTHLPDNYEDLYHQMLEEFHDPAFVATWTLRTAWGIWQPLSNTKGNSVR